MEKKSEVFVNSREGLVGMVSAEVLAIYEDMCRKNTTANGKSVAVGCFILNVFLIVPPRDLQHLTTDLTLP